MEHAARAPSFSRAFKRSVLAHTLVMGLAILGSLVTERPRERIVPTLRVDLVALPDQKKDEPISLPAPENAPTPPAPEKQVKTAPKIKMESAEVSLSKKQKTTAKSMKSALERLRALEKLQALKGNMISKGATTSGEAKEREQATYYDGVLQKLRENWELPSWLQTKGLSAQVVLFLNSKGNILRIVFKRPSGNDVYDEEVRRAVQRSAPFALPPQDVIDSLASDGVLLGFPL